MEARLFGTALLTLGVLAQGCFIDRAGTLGAEVDAGSMDAGSMDAAAEDAASPDAAIPDAGTDAGVDALVPLEDAGSDAGSDAGLDGGPECTATAPACEGEVYVTCVASARVEENCTPISAYCDPGPGCVGYACAPSSVLCADSANERRCDARGTGSTDMACTRGCSGGIGCNPATGCALPIHATLTGPGTTRVNTCPGGDDAVFLNPCTRVIISGPDLIVRFEVATRTSYRFELRALGGSDPVLYLRSACDVQSSQLACNDDGAAGVGSRIDRTLDPGDYFLVLDSFRDPSEPAAGRCGEMDLVITIR